jgi:hypothetical protein
VRGIQSVAVWFGLVWFGLVWFGLVWFGLVWFGLVWFGLVWLQEVSHFSFSPLFFWEFSPGLSWEFRGNHEGASTLFMPQEAAVRASCGFDITSKKPM